MLYTVSSPQWDPMATNVVWLFWNYHFGHINCLQIATSRLS